MANNVVGGIYECTADCWEWETLPQRGARINFQVGDKVLIHMSYIDDKTPHGGFIEVNFWGRHCLFWYRHFLKHFTRVE